jgi:hypothetical protein
MYELHMLRQGLFPRICISYTVKHINIVRYELHMLSDGSIFIERIGGLEEEATSKQKMIMIP